MRTLGSQFWHDLGDELDNQLDEQLTNPRLKNPFVGPLWDQLGSPLINQLWDDLEMTFLP